ncbi:hypothetical protein [Citreimonas salinaria]|uniref:Uncharacterized protein n=1 Tax=Citreimonas salinaria TaxID=321339 RepID=A0A1H3KH10_9RHOB|nr:hypothetical protein [Citreimonas salinaria]SDY51085.1 hypothetical protein SAMN05444340_109115 [Citreimonas salinaria]
MIAWLRVNVSRLVMRASERGNPLARRLNARATQSYIANLPPHSSIVPGPFQVPDLDRPLPDTARARLFGDHELTPLAPAPVVAEDLVGRCVGDIQTGLGSTGVGNHGFVGIDLGGDWLIVPLYAAAQWITLDGRLLADPGHAAAGRAAPWPAEDASARVAGATISAATLRPHAMRLDLDNGARLEIVPDPSGRPRTEHGGHVRAFLPEDDLSAAMFLSPTPVIYGLG